MNKHVLVTLFLIASLAIFACAPAQPAAPAASADEAAAPADSSSETEAAADEMTVYKIGAIHPLTGDGAVYGLPVQAVVEVALEDLNAKWAEKNMKLEIIMEDGKCNGKDALSAAQNLVNLQGVKVIYGGTCSSETLGFAPFAEENEILTFSSLSSSPDITNAGDFIFRNYPSDTAQVIKMMEMIREKGYGSIAILSENTDYAQALRNGYKTELEKEAIEVVADEVVLPNSNDVRTEVAKIKAGGADAIIYLPQTIPMAGIMAKQMFEAGVEGDILGSDVTSLDEGIKEYKEYMEGHYGVRSVFEKESSEEFAALKEKSGCELGFYCASTYDGLFILAEALEACGDQDTACLKDHMYGVSDWDGVLTSGTTIDENGDVAGSFEVTQVVDGELTVAFS